MRFWEKVKNGFKSFWQGIKNGWKNLWRKPQDKQGERVKSSSEGNMFTIICSWIYKLRSVFLAIPVLFTAILLAIQNKSRLPDTVHLIPPSIMDNLRNNPTNSVRPEDGYYFAGDKELIEKLSTMSVEQAVYGPLLITVFCLVMMFLSRRVTLPWLISIFSLILPPFIYLIVDFYAL